MASAHTDVTCMFCNERIAEDQEPLALNIAAGWSDSEATYWCHGRCLQGATHPEVPLYILSLHRDEAVYGTRSPSP